MNIQLSVVTTMYKSVDYLDSFYQRISDQCKSITNDYEIIMVNDGSPDASLEKALELHNIDHRIKVIDLSRNFGHHKAIMTGLLAAKGTKVFLIDCDLEEPPELLGSFYDLLQSDPTLDAVYGIQGKRKGGWFERVSGMIYYKIVNSLVDFPIPSNFLTVRLMSSRFVKELTRYQERELNFSTLISHTGFKTKSVKVKKGHKGETSYTLAAKLHILTNTITSSSSKPLWIIFHLGWLITLISFVVMVYFLLYKILADIDVEGWTSVIVSIWFMGGVIMLSLGVLGIYMSKIFIEVKQRPFVNTRQIYQRDEDDNYER